MTMALKRRYLVGEQVVCSKSVDHSSIVVGKTYTVGGKYYNNYDGISGGIAIIDDNGKDHAFHSECFTDLKDWKREQRLVRLLNAQVKL